MPDWSYRTVFQPFLLRLPFETARRLALGSMGRLAQSPGGTRLIDLMGHMAPDERLQTRFGKRPNDDPLVLAAPLMWGCHGDPELLGLPALDRFGFGLLEVGPVAAHARSPADATRIDAAAEILITPQSPGSLDSSTLIRRIEAAGIKRGRLIARLTDPPPEAVELAVDSLRQTIVALAPRVGSFALPLESLTDVNAVRRVVAELRSVADQQAALLLGVVTAGLRGEATAVAFAQAVIDAGADGVIVDATQVAPGGSIVRGAPCRDVALRLTESLRTSLGDATRIIAGGGVHEPFDAVRLMAAGATMVQVDSGLIFTGPGLPKRINDALLCLRLQSARATDRGMMPLTASRMPTVGSTSPTPPLPQPPSSSLSQRPGRQAWFWTLLMGVAMFLGGLLAMAIALTRVVMPYDEQFVGMTRQQLVALNDRLLLFMVHDRATLAGTMLAVGVLYVLFSWFGIRRGLHWAHVAVIASAFVGFVTFFAFLGFGYFDPLHAFVTAVLFQFLLLGVHSDTTRPEGDDVPNLTNHDAWQRSQWGQLLFVSHGLLLIAAGGVICSYGMTSVFVPEDLEFMNTTAEALCAANPQLVPLVAHDRATFGGMLIACGITVLLGALWGFRQGQAWLWWGLFLGGHVAYLTTILIHWSVGYTSLKHLLPAYAGLLLVWTGCSCSREFLCCTSQTDAQCWQEILAAHPPVDARRNP